MTCSITAERDRALYQLMEFSIMRYLMSNTHGRLDGYEKATRHMELSTIFCDVVLGRNNYETDTMMAVHDATQELTSHMDTEIGFPIYERPDYGILAPLFFRRFVEIARVALNEGDAKQAG